MSSRIAAGTAYSAIAVAVGDIDTAAGAALTACCTVGEIGTAVDVITELTGAGCAIRATDFAGPKKAGASIVQLGSTSGASAIMTSAKRPMWATHERSAAE